MSMQIIENWSEIHGMIHACQLASDLKDYYQVSVWIDAVSSVEGFANLLTDLAGTNLEILIPSALINTLQITPQVYIECRVRRASHGRIYIHHEHIRISKSLESTSDNL
jgi:hypothetical protein